MNLKYKKGYSIVEILVSLAILSIVITMLFNVLIVGLQGSLKIIARSFVREELSAVTALVAKDIRNSDRVIFCGESLVQNSCEFFKNNIRYRWSICTDDGLRICKYDLSNPGNPVKVFENSRNVNVTLLEFAQGIGAGNSQESRNVLITLVASHNNSYVNVTNVFRQTSVSTRNYSY